METNIIPPLHMQRFVDECRNSKANHSYEVISQDENDVRLLFFSKHVADVDYRRNHEVNDGDHIHCLCTILNL